MNQDQTQAAVPIEQPDAPAKLGSLSALGAVTGGIFASACCILPLVLVSVGVGGAWMSTLTALSPYQPYFIALTVISVGGGFWVSRRARRSVCAATGPCVSSQGQKRYVYGLWFGAILAMGAVVTNTLVPLFYRF